MRIVCFSTKTSKRSHSEQVRFNATLPPSSGLGADPETPSAGPEARGSEKAGATGSLRHWAEGLAGVTGLGISRTDEGQILLCPWPWHVSRLFNHLPTVSSVNSDDEDDVCLARSGRAGVRKPTGDRGELLESSGMWVVLGRSPASTDGWLPGACSLL